MGCSASAHACNVRRAPPSPRATREDAPGVCRQICRQAEAARPGGPGMRGRGVRGRGMRGRVIRAHLPAKGSSTHGCRADQRTAAAPTHSITAVQLNSEPTATQSTEPPCAMADQRGTAEPGTEPDAVKLCRVARVLNVAFRAVRFPSSFIVRPRRVCSKARVRLPRVAAAAVPGAHLRPAPHPASRPGKAGPGGQNPRA